MNHSAIIRSVCRVGLKSPFMFPVGARSNGRMRTLFGGIKVKPIQRLLLFFALISTAPSAWAGCTEGDQKCGASGYVLTCEKSIWVRSYWTECASELEEEREYDERREEERERREEEREEEREKREEEREKREEGREKREEERQRAARVCEPGLRRCHAGMVQTCDYDGEGWSNEYESCTSHEINRGDHQYD